MARMKEWAYEQVWKLYNGGEHRVWKIAEILGCSEAFVVACLNLG